MPVPPILDVYVVWHPNDDAVGSRVFRRLHDHFHAEAYAGLVGGAIEVYSRSVGWDGPVASPRPLLLPGAHSETLPAAQLAVVIPVLGTGLRAAVEAEPAWREYAESIAASASAAVGVYPVLQHNLRLDGSVLGRVFLASQFVDAGAYAPEGDLERAVAQAAAQLAVGTGDRIQVFVSHAKHASDGEGIAGRQPVYETARSVIAGTKLTEFFDAHDLQAGDDWAGVLDEKAGESALLMVRTDRYAGREWTQREVLAAKRHDVPIVALVALTDGEPRGSFLMDHVPTVPFEPDDAEASITRALNRLVDESLKRALWLAQVEYVHEQGFDWTPVHAPEPVTAITWLTEHRTKQADDRHLWIIHPDPPLGPAERRVTDELCALAGFEDARVDILTPRTFAARGGVLPHGC